MTEQKARMVITNYAIKAIKEAKKDGNIDEVKTLIEAVDLITGKYSMALQARSITDIHFGSAKPITANHIGDTFEHY